MVVKSWYVLYLVFFNVICLPFLKNPIPDQRAVFDETFEITVCYDTFESDKELNFSVTKKPDWMNVSPSIPSFSLLGSIDTYSNAKGIVVIESYAYVSNLESLTIIDVTNKTTPEIVGNCETSQSTGGLFVDGSYPDYAYIADGNFGLRIIDISNKSFPFLISTYNEFNSIYDVAVVNDSVAYLTDFISLQIIDVTNKTSPYVISSIGSLSDAVTVFIDDNNFAYVPDDYFLLIVNITDPTSPIITYVFELLAWAESIYVSGDYAYITEFDFVDSSYLEIIDISNKSSPVQIGTYEYLSSWGSEVVLYAENYCVISDEDLGLLIIDVSDKTSPELIGEYYLYYAEGVNMDRNIAYVADGDLGIKIIETQLGCITISGICDNSTDTQLVTVKASDFDGFESDSFLVSCECHENWFGSECSECILIMLDVCKNGGFPDNNCSECVCIGLFSGPNCTDCKLGWYGEHCNQSYICDGYNNSQTSDVCSGGRGICISSDDNGYCSQCLPTTTDDDEPTTTITMNLEDWEGEGVVLNGSFCGEKNGLPTFVFGAASSSGNSVRWLRNKYYFDPPVGDNKNIIFEQFYIRAGSDEDSSSSSSCKVVSTVTKLRIYIEIEPNGTSTPMYYVGDWDGYYSEDEWEVYTINITLRESDIGRRYRFFFMQTDCDFSYSTSCNPGFWGVQDGCDCCNLEVTDLGVDPDCYDNSLSDYGYYAIGMMSNDLYFGDLCEIITTCYGFLSNDTDHACGGEEYGNCTEFNHCECIFGVSVFENDACVPGCSTSQLNDCSGNGECFFYEFGGYFYCECDEGYIQGGDCSEEEEEEEDDDDNDNDDDGGDDGGLIATIFSIISSIFVPLMIGGGILAVFLFICCVCCCTCIITISALLLIFFAVRSKNKEVEKKLEEKYGETEEKEEEEEDLNGIELPDQNNNVNNHEIYVSTSDDDDENPVVVQFNDQLQLPSSINPDFRDFNNNNNNNISNGGNNMMFNNSPVGFIGQPPPMDFDSNRM